MLYYGLFISSSLFNSPDCELGISFKKFVLNDEQYTKEITQKDVINPEDISINIEFYPYEVTNSINFLLQNNDVKCGYEDYILNINRSLGNHFNIKFTGYLDNDELYFRVFRDMGIEEGEEIFMTMEER